MREFGSSMEVEAARGGVDFSKCQIDRVIKAYEKDPRKFEFESVSPYLADYDGRTGEMWGYDKMVSHDKIGIAIARMLRQEFQGARMVSLYDEYNSDMPNTANPTGSPVAGGKQLEYSAEARAKFRQSIEERLREQHVIREDDQEGADYLFVSESEKINDAVELVRQLEGKGFIRYIERQSEDQEIKDPEIRFFDPRKAERDSEYEGITLRTKNGRWLCEALDTSSFLRPENREITHLVILPNQFKTQQDKVWEILRTLEIARPDTYHNIFFDEKLSPEAVAEVIRLEIAKNTRQQTATRLAA